MIPLLKTKEDVGGKSEDMALEPGLGLGEVYNNTLSDPQTEDPKTGLETLMS